MTSPTPKPTPVSSPTPVTTPTPTPVAINPNDLFVSTTGSDSNPGTQAAPFKTILKASQVVKPGGTVHVAPGTYPEAIEITTKGLANAPIRFISSQRWQAKVTGNGSSASTFMVRSDYIEIVNFEITSSGGYQGIELFGSYGKALTNHVHHILAGACASGLGGAGISSSHSPPWANPYSDFTVGTGNIISGNLVHDIGDPTLGCAFIHGIYIMNYQNTVTNNIVYKTMGWGVTSWHYSRNNILSNNTVFNNNVGGINTGANDGGTVDDFTMVSNNLIFYNGLPSGGWVANNVKAGRYGITQEGNYGSNNKFLNNIVFGNQPTDYNTNVSPSGGQLVDPTLGTIFMNWQKDGSGDYHLKSTSPAIDKGSSTSAPPIDFDGAARPQGAGVDIGAFEAR
jgi:hypothetical protein